MYVRTEAGRWWSNTATSAIRVHNLRSWNGGVIAQGNDLYGEGFALRWVAIMHEPDGELHSIVSLANLDVYTSSSLW